MSPPLCQGLDDPGDRCSAPPGPGGALQPAVPPGLAEPALEPEPRWVGSNDDDHSAEAGHPTTGGAPQPAVPAPSAEQALELEHPAGANRPDAGGAPQPAMAALARPAGEHQSAMAELDLEQTPAGGLIVRRLQSDTAQPPAGSGRAAQRRLRAGRSANSLTTAKASTSALSTRSAQRPGPARRQRPEPVRHPLHPAPRGTVEHAPIPGRVSVAS